MSLETISVPKQYSGNGVTTAFSYPYKFFADGDLVVILTSSAGVETTQTITTHYTVSGAGEDAGGTVTMVTAPASGETLTIYRDPDATQSLDLRENDPAPAEEMEKAWDRLTMLVQRINEVLDRSVTITNGFVDTFTLTLPSDLATANATLVVNATGDGWDMGPTSTEVANAQTYATNAAASATAAASSASAAATSATNAATSATSAAASATTAQTAVGSMFWNDVVFLTNADSPYTVSESDRGKLLDIDCSSGNVTVNLPSIAALDLGSPYVVGIKKSDSSGNSITVNRNGTDTINGDTSKVHSVAQGGAVYIPDTDPSPDEWTTTEFGPAAGNLTVDSFNGDGSTVAFVMSIDPGSENNTWVYVEGIYQEKDTYSVSGTTLTFSTAPPTGTGNIEVIIGTTLSIGTPSDGTVTRAKLASGAVAPKNNAAKTANYTVTTNDDILLGDSSGGAFTFTMPTEASASGREFIFKKTSSDVTAITINDDAASEITTLNTEGETVKIFTDGTSWYVIDRYIPSEWKNSTLGSSGFGTTANATYRSRRVGDSLEIESTFDAGTVAASEARVNLLYDGNAITSDSSYPTLQMAGVMKTNNSESTTDFQDRQVLIEPSVTYVTFAASYSTYGTGLAKANGNGLTTSGAKLSMFTKFIKISGWKG